MSYYPVFLDILERPVLVIGGGKVAERKVSSLLKAGAVVTVVSPTLTSALKGLSMLGSLTHIKGRYKRGMLEGFFLVISASNSKKVNTAVKREATETGTMVNVVDAPSLCDFIVPSVVNRGPLQIAISTGANFPALSRKMRLELEKLYGGEWKMYVEILGAFRNKLLKDKRKSAKKEGLMRRLLAAPIPGWLASRDFDELDSFLTGLCGRGYSLGALKIEKED